MQGTEVCIAVLSKENCQVNVNETECPAFAGSIEHSKSIVHTKAPLHSDQQSSSIYIDQRILPLLLLALEEILVTDKSKSLLDQVNALDKLAQILWNWNPRRLRKVSSSDLQQWLSMRSYSPKTKLWSKVEAVQCLQRYVRGWLVRKRVDVQELRQFWKDLAEKGPFIKQIENHTILKHSTDILGKPWITDKYKMYDANFLHCKTYRRMIMKQTQ